VISFTGADVQRRIARETTPVISDVRTGFSVPAQEFFSELD